MIVLIIFISTQVSIFYITGYSMDPEVKHHDIVILMDEPQKQHIEVGENVMVEKDDYPLYHEVRRKNDDKLITKGINTTYKDNPSSYDRVIGEELFVIRTPKILKKYITPLIMANTYSELESNYK